MKKNEKISKLNDLKFMLLHINLFYINSFERKFSYGFIVFSFESKNFALRKRDRNSECFDEEEREI